MRKKGKGSLPGESYSPAEMKTLLEQFNTRCLVPTRNKALAVVMWRCGLRCFEALALMPGDVADGIIRVLHGKGNKPRTVAIDPHGMQVLQAWLDRKQKLGIGGPIFSTRQGRPLQTSYVRQFLPRMAAKAGIAKRMHAHGLRHSCACDLADEGQPLRVISKVLGHASFATTQTYLDHLGHGDVVDALKARTW